MSGRIVLFGATGYTGELTARALVRQGARPVLAGRSAQRLSALAEQLGDLDTAVADVDIPDTVRALVGAGDVLISTVGPFLRYGQPAVLAAIDAGSHYLDSTGEPPFIREVFERHAGPADRAGVGLLTAFGFDWVPGNLAGALALRDAGPGASKVDIGYFVSGGAAAASGGTRASVAGLLLEPGFGWRDGTLRTERLAGRVRTFTVAGRTRTSFSIGSSEHFALPREHPGLREVGVYLGVPPAVSPAIQATSWAASAARRIPGAPSLIGGVLSKVVRGSTGGPDARSRARTKCHVVAVASDPAGRCLGEVRLTGGNPYDITADLLAWGSRRAAAGGLRGTGALGPVDAFDLDGLTAGATQAGLDRTHPA